MKLLDMWRTNLLVYSDQQFYSVSSADADNYPAELCGYGIVICTAVVIKVIVL